MVSNPPAELVFRLRHQDEVRRTNRSFVEPFLARIFSLSALESRSRSPLRERVRRPSVLTTQRRRRYSRPQTFLLVPNVLYSLDQRLHHSRSRAPPSKGVSTVCSSSVALLSFHFPGFNWHLHFSACFFLLRLLSPVLIFPELQATFLTQVSPLVSNPPRNWSQGYVTKTKSAALNRSFLLSRSSPGHFSVLLWRVALSHPYAGVSAD